MGKGGVAADLSRQRAAVTPGQLRWPSLARLQQRPEFRPARTHANENARYLQGLGRAEEQGWWGRGGGWGCSRPVPAARGRGGYAGAVTMVCSSARNSGLHARTRMKTRPDLRGARGGGGRQSRAPGPALGSASRPGSHARAAVGRISRPGSMCTAHGRTRGDLHVTDRDAVENVAVNVAL
jgi:hypothetical protein